MDKSLARSLGFLSGLLSPLLEPRLGSLQSDCDRGRGPRVHEAHQGLRFLLGASGFSRGIIRLGSASQGRFSLKHPKTRPAKDVREGFGETVDFEESCPHFYVVKGSRHFRNC